jgi:hypothetical protein
MSDLAPINFEALYNEYRDDAMVLELESYAVWTIPSVFPRLRLGKTRQNHRIEHDYQSMGALLVNNLATKLCSSLFPANQSFFRISVDEEFQKMLRQNRDFDEKAAKARVIEIEREACGQLFLNAAYAQMIQALRFLIITGNALLYRSEEKFTVFSLHNYTMHRDRSGNVLDIIVKEILTYGSLPIELMDVIPRGEHKDTDEVVVWTRIKREVRKKGIVYIVSQQVNGIDVGKRSIYPEKLCPYIPVVWNHINGDSYGRSHVEDYAGDFAKLSDLSRALTLYEIDACKVVNLVKPGSTVDLDSMNDAEIGEYVYGDPEAIKKHSGGEFQFIKSLLDDIQTVFQRLGTAFMYAGNIRDAERVTAEEIRQNAAEADKTLGGVYSRLAEGIHLPLSYVLTHEVEPKLIGSLLNKNIKLKVLTGLAALGRAAEVNNLTQAVQILAAIVPAMKQISARFDTEAVVDRVMESFGLNTKDYFLTPEALQKQTDANQAAMSQLDPATQAGNPMDTSQALQGAIQ